jgi:CheY-like chemotaxis protein
MAHFLIVEDNHTNLDLITYLLRSFGHTYSICMTGNDAVEQLAMEKFDLMVCDLQLPGLDGYGVVDAVRKGGSKLPMVAVSSFAMVGDKEKALQAGFNGYIAKPIDPQTFVKELEGFLGPVTNA